MEYTDGFVSISALFYVVFHPTEGTKVVHQVPQGSIVPSLTTNDSSALQTPLFDFAIIKNYVIPKPQLCDRLISCKIDQYRVIGYPVNIINSRYARNSFSFNFCFVFPYDSDTTPYEQAIKRVGRMFRVLEEQSQLLSKQNKTDIFFRQVTPPSSAGKTGKEGISELTYGTTLSSPTTGSFVQDAPGQKQIRKVKLSSIESLVQQMFQDLNNYSECLIPLDSANSVDIKLFPLFPPPPNINSSDVPITTVKLKSLVDLNWDPTMVKILPFINGINSIKRISQLADAEYLLTKKCIQHLMHYKCIVILDIFQFSNIYAPTNKIGAFLEDNMADECQSYVVAPNPLSKLPLTSSSNENEDTRSLHSMKSQPDHEYGDNAMNKDKRDFKNYNTISEYNPISVSPFSRPSYLRSTNQSTSNVSSKESKEKIYVPSKSVLFALYRSLHQGQTVKEWYIQHKEDLKQIDIRRFLSFGVLRGIIYRVHAYPIMESFLDDLQIGDEAVIDEYDSTQARSRRNSKSISKSRTHSALIDDTKSGMLFKDRASEKRKLSFRDGSKRLAELRGTSSGLQYDSSTEVFTDEESSIGHLTEDQNLQRSKEKAETQQLVKLLKKFHNYDMICTEMQKSKKEVEAMIAKLGDFKQVNS